jgi:hypothetical protein
MMARQFRDSSGGYYFSAADANDLIVRQKVGSDSPLPSGNAIAALVHLAMGDAKEARAILAIFAPQLRQQVEGMSAMLQATMELVRASGPLVVEPAGDATIVQRPLSPDEIAAGIVTLRAEQVEPRQWRIHLDILHGFHINTNTPGPGLIATALTATGAEIESAEFPRGKLRRLAYADEDVELYEGSVTIGIKLRSPARDDAAIRVSYQACDETACLPPVTKSIALAGSAP